MQENAPKADIDDSKPVRRASVFRRLVMSFCAICLSLLVGSCLLLLLFGLFIGHSWIMVCGNIVDRDGNPIRDAQIDAFDLQSGVRVDNVSSNEDGRYQVIYSFGGLRFTPKAINVSVHKEGFAPYTQRFDESHHDECTHTIVLDPLP